METINENGRNGQEETFTDHERARRNLIRRKRRALRKENWDVHLKISTDDNPIHLSARNIDEALDILAAYEQRRLNERSAEGEEQDGKNDNLMD